MEINIKLTAKSNANLDRLARMEPDDLELLTVSQLRKLARDIVNGYSTGLKGDLIEMLMQAAQERREAIAEAERHAAKVNGYQGELTRKEATAAMLWQKLEAIANETSKWEAKQERILSLVVETFVREREIYADATVTSNLTVYSKYWKHKAETTEVNREAKLAVFQLFDRLYRGRVGELKSVVSDRTKAKLRAQTSNQSVVSNVEGLITWAHQYLEDLPGNSGATWQCVYIALGYATGRRLAELGSSGEFEAGPGGLDVCEVYFKGLAKSAGNEKSNQRFLIPTLVPARLVLRGQEWLKQRGKRYGDKKTAHNMLAGNISRVLKPGHASQATWTPFRDIRPTVTIDDALSGNRKHLGTLKFKDLRALYALTCYELNGGNISVDDYIKRVLLHDTENDSSAKNYQRFKVVLGKPEPTPQPKNPITKPARKLQGTEVKVAMSAELAEQLELLEAVMGEERLTALLDQVRRNLETKKQTA